MVTEDEIFIYAGVRDIDYLDRKLYKVKIKFTDEIVDLQNKKLIISSDNSENNNFTPIGIQSYSISESMDDLKPYLKKIFITLNLEYTFDDYTTVPGQKIQYHVVGTLSMERKLNTLIPDEDQQIQW